MLDLSRMQRFYQFTWFDGKVISLKKPSEALMRDLSAFVDADNSDDEYVEKMKETTINLVKDNCEGRVFTEEELDQLDLVVCTMILKDYLETVQKRLGE